MATQTITQNITTKRVTVPEQALKPVKQAYETARALGGILASFNNVVFDKPILENAKGKYLFAVDSNGLPDKKGWYEVVRKDDIVEFKSMDEMKAQTLIDKNLWHDVLYVNQNAIDASKEKRPVALGVGYYRYRRFLYADGWSNYVARVALIKPEPKLEDASQVARMLRPEKGELLEVTLPDGQKISLKAIEATIRKE